LAGHATRAGSASLGVGPVVGSFACLTLSAPALISTNGRSVVESLNVITAGALIVLGLTMWAARQLPLRPPTNGVAPIQP